jgi:hypothetical protein
MSTWLFDLDYCAAETTRPRVSGRRPRAIENASLRTGGGERRRADTLAGHVFCLSVVRELPRSYVWTGDTTW